MEAIDIALDVGSTLVNPEAVDRQLRGQIAFAMGYGLHQITFEKGRVKESNFHDYPLVRMAEFPKHVQIEYVRSDHWVPIGEEVIPQILPAICNAVFAATGKRIRSLPITREGFSWA